MPARARLTLFLLGALFIAQTAAAAPSADRLRMLSRGINVTHWFRYPPSNDPAAMAAYLSDQALRDLRQAGFTLIRLPIEPELLSRPEAVRAISRAIQRIQAAGLAAMPVIYGARWNLETNPLDRTAFFAAWRILAPALHSLPPDRTFPELLNEPVFHGAASEWQMLQERLRALVRSFLPAATIVLTGPNWSSVDGLTGLTPAADSNVVYTFHFYQPAELTSLAAWQPQVDKVALAHLPFPVGDPGACVRSSAASDAATAGIIKFYCDQRWDGRAIEAVLAKASAWALAHGAQVFAGEFGASVQLNPAARLAWLRAVRQSCEQHGIGWALWGYDDIMGFNVAPPLPVRPALNPAILESLGLPDKKNISPSQ